MNNLNKVIPMLVGLIFVQTAYAEREVGNGGDVVKCQKSSENTFEGFYSLDYFRLQSSQADFYEPESLENSFDRIEGILSSLPEVLTRFKNFRQTYLQENWSQDRIWEPSDLDVADIRDEELTVVIPSNCKLIQAIRRTKNQSGVTIYQYNQTLLKSLEARPLQLSMLIFHEFLWDLTDHIAVNYRANRFVHGQKITDAMSVDQIFEVLKNIGLSFKTQNKTQNDTESGKSQPWRDQVIKSLQKTIDHVELEEFVSAEEIMDIITVVKGHKYLLEKRGDQEFVDGLSSIQEKLQTIQLAQISRKTRIEGKTLARQLRECVESLVGSTTGSTKSAERRITTTGAVFVRDTSNAELGDAWRDERDVVWGDIVKRADGSIDYMNHAEATTYCKDIGAELPTYEDFTYLREAMGAKPGTNEGYTPQVLPNLNRQLFLSSSLYPEPDAPTRYVYYFVGTNGHLGGVYRGIYIWDSVRCVVRR